MSADETSKENENEVNSNNLVVFEYVNDQCSEVEEGVSVINGDTGRYNDSTVVETRLKDVTNFTRLSGGLYCVQVMTQCRPIRVTGIVKHTHTE